MVIMTINNKVKQFLLILIASSVVLSACTNDKGDNKENNKPALPLIGADADEHNCKATAGETWSELKQSCLRVFEQGIRLNPNDASLDQSLSAFALFNGEEDTKVELFMPKLKGSKILTKTAANTWEFNDLMLSKEGTIYSLILDNKAFYRSK